mmetsp:Transcript_41556/g.50559  ORF Transcript_41556/g.50559 Transcript_41556/m.50559 type:complete len:85 (-) Transcript_41556:17-271(-)
MYASSFLTMQQRAAVSVCFTTLNASDSSVRSSFIRVHNSFKLQTKKDTTRVNCKPLVSARLIISVLIFDAEVNYRFLNKLNKVV